MPRLSWPCFLSVLLSACAAGDTASGIRIADAPRAVNRFFSEFDGMIDDANRAINRSLNPDASAQGDLQ
ncbi:hypothetical protein CBR67_12625 [Bordetella hinzii]|uniref:hypothetical protein n=1 Tax=Bordetella hinzii TaxID=103855 RepID=UPI0011520FCC|nr:hypothetical protein [Bordetella hinzii]QDJ37434.1 hypothetical protein CBR67_12625 [Bordetella hinzii]